MKLVKLKNFNLIKQYSRILFPLSRNSIIPVFHYSNIPVYELYIYNLKYTKS